MNYSKTRFMKLYQTTGIPRSNNLTSRSMRLSSSFNILLMALLRVLACLSSGLLGQQPILAVKVQCVSAEFFTMLMSWNSETMLWIKFVLLLLLLFSTTTLEKRKTKREPKHISITWHHVGCFWLEQECVKKKKSEPHFIKANICLADLARLGMFLEWYQTQYFFQFYETMFVIARLKVVYVEQKKIVLLKGNAYF